MLITLLLATGLTVSLPSEVRIAGTELTVGSVAVLNSDDAEVVAKVKELPLGYSPAPGYSRLIWAHQLEVLIQATLPEVEVEFSGESACRVWPLTQTIDSELIRKAAEQELKEWIGGRDVSYELRKPIPSLVVPQGTEQPEIVVRHMRDPLRPGVINLPVRIHIDGEVYRTSWTSWDVTVWETAQVLSRRVHSGERVTKDMLVNRRVPRDYAGESVPLSGERLIGAIAKHELQPNSAIRSADVERPLVITTGDAIFVQVHKGNVNARMRGVARASGALGDRISVVCTDSNQELTGLIVRPGLVDVDLNAVRSNGQTPKISR